ncbi:uncharacterized protein LOC143248685 [Tachypleus tridentatus]|uniref:uncharacterized protein LOC143248685 n=1 Tax=Tachypleus tridentatus TaxID=6853 RepID=UPI003FD17FFD
MDETGGCGQSSTFSIMSHPKSSNINGNSAHFIRNTLARNTVVRQCRDFYMEKLKRSETFRRRLSTSAVNIDIESSPATPLMSQLSAPTNTDIREDPHINSNSSRKFGSGLNTSMNQLRQEIESFIDQDNELFRKLLSLYDTIAELRDRQQEVEEGSSDGEVEDSPSLESLSDTYNQTTTTSPSSTLSSCSSHCAQNKPCILSRAPLRRHLENSTQRQLSSNSAECSRCSSGKKMAPQYNRRRAKSYGMLYYRDDDIPSYDSGIYLQGYHSDSDHEIFV